MNAPRWTPLLCAALLGLAPLAARAEDACAADALRLCPDVPAGEGRILDCLRARWYAVSSSCQQTIQGVEARARQIGVACNHDVYEHCRRVPLGGGRVLSCLAANWEQLSTTCSDAVAKVAERARQFAGACGADAERLCAGVEPGGGRIFACLKLQERAVSSRCRAALRP
jgi:hypothetical protein